MYSNVHENPSYMLAFEIKGGGVLKKKVVYLTSFRV